MKYAIIDMKNGNTITTFDEYEVAQSYVNDHKDDVYAVKELGSTHWLEWAPGFCLLFLSIPLGISVWVGTYIYKKVIKQKSKSVSLLVSVLVALISFVLMLLLLLAIKG